MLALMVIDGNLMVVSGVEQTQSHCAAFLGDYHYFK